MIKYIKIDNILKIPEGMFSVEYFKNKWNEIQELTYGLDEYSLSPDVVSAMIMCGKIIFEIDPDIDNYVGMDVNNKKVFVAINV